MGIQTKKIVSLVLLLFVLGVARAQNKVKVVVKSKVSNQNLANATVSEGKTPLRTIKDDGVITIKNISAGQHLLTFTYVGYHSFDTTITVVAGNNMLAVFLQPDDKALEEVTVVSSTRSNQRIESSPLKVEVLDKEEVEEESTIKPANIASLLSDLSGIQIQQSSQVSGNSNVRIQGLDGRYTQVLRDGMPLFDGFSGGFGILQIPPLDLKQIELVKGSASTLYGGGAIGGLINIISKKPTFNQDGILILNQTTLNESNVNTYVAKRGKKLGYSFFGGLTHQLAVDVNGDGLSDLPKTDAVIVHPRLFYYPSTKSTLAIGYTGTFETRKGGDMQVLSGKADAVHAYFEQNKTSRNTGDISFEQSFTNGEKLEIKSSISSFTRNILTNIHSFKGNQLNYFNEVSLLIPKKRFSWVMGLNALGDQFKIQPSDPVLFTNFSNNTIGGFAQMSGKLFKETTIEVGLRADHHNQYGDFILPRLAFFQRIDKHWATRWGVGFGYKTPNILTVQNQDYAIQNIQSLPADISAEKSVGYNAEINYKLLLGGEASLFINQAFFLTRINNPVIATENAQQAVSFSNAAGNITTQGSDTYIKVALEDWELYAGYTYTDASRNYLKQNQFMPLTPKNRFSFVGTYEVEGEWRFGLEASYTSAQYRDGDTKTEGYPIFALMAVKNFSHHITLVLNCEDILDYRQSKQEALYTGSITNPVFKQVWAPTDGRVLNLSLRWDWGKK